MFAIIETGGKQYKVAEGDIIRVELLEAEPESTLTIDKVLAVFDGEKLDAGKPYLENATVNCKVLEHGKAKKVVVFHYKPKRTSAKRTVIASRLPNCRLNPSAADMQFGGIT